MVGQFGEGQIIDEVFGLEFKGTAIDVGACQGTYLSTTYHLEHRGWTVLAIEPNPHYWPELDRLRKRPLHMACGNRDEDGVDFTVVEMGPDQAYWSAVSSLEPNPEQLELHKSLIKRVDVVKVPVRRLDTIIEEQQLEQINFLSIDCEGTDMQVLEGFDVGRWLPELIFVENWSEDERFLKYLEPFGYGERIRMGVNDIFINGNGLLSD